ncbi:MAG: FtsP/CotA-like multicopper oxidase with cupredoxin domain [Pseudohongiellaceae bacterium]|jgi:FtsP/CotA-like multicopper oxidase with cupredoxin domain
MAIIERGDTLMRTFGLACLALATLVTLAPSTSAQFTEPPVAPDLNASPTIVEVSLEASQTTKQYLPGAATAVSAYNGTIPGPTLEANVGDTLIVHFTNNLPDETTIHWHGIEAPAQMDGSHVAQKPIPGNGGTFDYEFKLLSPGLYWYHPHIRTSEAVESGLYGAIMVNDPVGEAGLGLPVNERIVILDDISLDLNNQIETHFPSDPLEKINQTLNGRVGNTLLVNGVVAPQVFPVTNGQPERWRILDVANTHFFRVSYEDSSGGTPQSLYRIGGDGGLLEAPQVKPSISVIIPPPGGGYAHASSNDPDEGIFLTPGERADVIWTPSGTNGDIVEVKTHDWNRGAHAVMFDPGGSGNIVLGDDISDGNGLPKVLFDLRIQGAPAAPFVPPSPLRDIAEIDPMDVVGTLKYRFGHSMPPFAPDGSGLKLFMQMEGMGMMMSPIPMMKMTSLQAHDVNIGDTYIWEVTNMTHMDHPFHTHGWSFQPYELQYTHVSNPLLNYTVPIGYVENKDTFRVPGRLDPMPMSSTVVMRAYATFDDTGREGMVRAEGRHPADDVSGGWLAHCHILEHAGAGMMAFFEARYPGHLHELLGYGLGGVSGIPEMRLSGDLTAGSATTLTMRHGAPSAFVGLIVGTGVGEIPFKGGTLLPSSFVMLFLNTDASGDLDLSSPWPANLASGTELYWQAWLQDGAAVQGFSASNALKSMTP